ncbi:tRNA (adenosine(37)-N6)-threonylcarbamoyltransferase complex transferase subunit TsaD [Collinsella sp. zg1085]|uniref:tRNA (adenosine(37)-N6)-threonylcarbamoyltransferase complex transferase subunit TsaD n=1 Tax=Collinsella sp. zg1085 TaxID=2844380 RepID=UPI0021138AD6|nr:tRNA (adenosine(37)-N6)-threonylcarbamoyltransferase complex transferase subunit TsaD [Collinsella sp. zg1085]
MFEFQTGIIAALDTSTDMLVCTLARIHDSGFEVLGIADHICRRKANVELVPTLEALLSEQGMGVDALEALLVGRGPGSFTGVRIGISTAKGLAIGAHVPLFGASSLDACAWGAWRTGIRGRVAVAADAMRGELYPALYELNDDGAQRLFERERVVKAAAVVDEWAQLPEANTLQLIGDGLKRYRSLFEEVGFAEQLLPENLWWPSGAGLVHAFVAADGAAHASGNPAAVLPVYTRLSDAEEHERARLGKGVSATLDTSGVADDVAGRHLQLRPMGVADAEAAAALDSAAFEGITHSPWSATSFLEELDESLPVPHSWWVAHDAGELLGFAGGRVVDAHLELLNVAVKSAARRQGIARKLLAQLTYDAQMLGCTSVSLEVEEQNTAAQSLYVSLGFEVVGRRADYYGAGASAFVMSAALPLHLPRDAHSPEPTAEGIKTWSLQRIRRTNQEREALAERQLILAIESSCDETAVAIVDKAGTMLANQISTQIDFHARFGGVVPEIASRKHVEVMVSVVEAALEEASEALGLKSGTLQASELAAISVTQGPGLVGALVVGVAFAKGMAYAAGVPLICVNHLEGHLFANRLTDPTLEPPFIFTLVSGGHTMLVHVRAWGDYEVLGETLDDAVGEAFDKVAKALGLGYPGGPVISRLAESGNASAIDFPRAMMHSHDYRFSLSGLKTAVVSYIEQETAAGRVLHLPDIAASFEAAVFDVQYKKAWDALRETGAQSYCLGGGVAANAHLRALLEQKLTKRGIKVVLPPQQACTDNAAMIAEVARQKFASGEFAQFNVDADPNMSL